MLKKIYIAIKKNRNIKRTKICSVPLDETHVRVWLSYCCKSFDYFNRLASELPRDNPLIHGTFL